MADNTPIEWCDATWNIVTGCTLVDEGCRHCYAAHLITSWPAIGNHPSRKGLARKNAAGESKFTGEVRFNEQWLDQPLRWKKARRIFVCAHGDLFHPAVPDEWLDRVFAVMALCPQHTFQVLTKRPERAREYLDGEPQRRIVGLYAKRLRTRGRGESGPLTAFDIACDKVGLIADLPEEVDIVPRLEARALKAPWPLPNVWLGTSISDQASADLRVPELLACPAAVRFISAEPLLGAVDLVNLHPTPMLTIDSLGGRLLSREGDYEDGLPKLDWVIVGGESGPNARPMHPDWARSLRDQCVAAGTAFFFKQWGEWAPDDHFTHFPDPVTSRGMHEWFEADDTTVESHSWRYGKKAAGRLLDGRTWDQMPGVTA